MEIISGVERRCQWRIRAAERLGETADRLDEIADQLEPEDGCLQIYDTDERNTLGLTERGIDSLKELIADQKR